MKKKFCLEHCLAKRIQQVFFEVIEDNNRLKIQALEDYDDKQRDWIAEFFPRENLVN